MKRFVPVAVKGPNIMLGYQNRPEANTETFDNEGFMRTGDIVEIDSDKYIYILDRVKEVCPSKAGLCP